LFDNWIWATGRQDATPFTYRHHAAVAEMPVAFCFFRLGRPDIVSFAPALTSRPVPSKHSEAGTAGYVTHSSGGVGGGSREATPYPYVCVFLLYKLG